MSTLKSLGIVGAVFVVVVASAAVFSLLLRGSPGPSGTETETAAIEPSQSPAAPPAGAAADEATAPRREAAAAMAPGADPGRPDRGYDIVEILPKNFIPAVMFPYFYDAEEAEAVYGEEELVIGLSIGGEHRAYSVPYLSGREIVNDTVGGVKVAVTW